MKISKTIRVNIKDSGLICCSINNLELTCNPEPKSVYIDIGGEKLFFKQHNSTFELSSIMNIDLELSYFSRVDLVIIFDTSDIVDIEMNIDLIYATQRSPLRRESNKNSRIPFDKHKPYMVSYRPGEGEIKHNIHESKEMALVLFLWIRLEKVESEEFEEFESYRLTYIIRNCGALCIKYVRYDITKEHGEFVNNNLPFIKPGMNWNEFLLYHFKKNALVLNKNITSVEDLIL